MRTLVGDEGLRRRLGEAAWGRVLAEHTIERMTVRTASRLRSCTESVTPLLEDLARAVVYRADYDILNR
jgi:hypothetical protein